MNAILENNDSRCIFKAQDTRYKAQASRLNTKDATNEFFNKSTNQQINKSTNQLINKSTYQLNTYV
jgi:hypothetical protein